MPHISMVVAHQLPQEEAVRRIREKASEVRQANQDKVSDARDEWEGNKLSFAFSVMGMQISGTCEVEPSEVRIDVDVPLMAMMFRGPIERRAREELDQLLAV
jgi:hypothetical protein